MTDRRVRPRLKPPGDPRRSHEIQAWLSGADYRLFYDVVMHHGTSAAETLRILIRNAHKEIDHE